MFCLKLRQFCQKRSLCLVSVGIKQVDSGQGGVASRLFDDAESRGNADSTDQERNRPGRVLRHHELAVRAFDFDGVAWCQPAHGPLEGGISQPGGDGDVILVRRARDREAVNSLGVRDIRERQDHLDELAGRELKC